ncbi:MULTISPECIES: hypothetical protein [Frankia]|nr:MULTISPECIES: hypothetical protein [Frankia]
MSALRMSALRMSAAMRRFAPALGLPARAEPSAVLARASTGPTFAE